jgi:hypothetical protein
MKLCRRWLAGDESGTCPRTSDVGSACDTLQRGGHLASQSVRHLEARSRTATPRHVAREARIVRMPLEASGDRLAVDFTRVYRTKPLSLATSRVKYGDWHSATTPA